VGCCAALLGVVVAGGGPAGCLAGIVTIGDRLDGGTDAGAPPDGPRGCQGASECDDGDECTTDECDRWTGQCVHQSSCCASPADCDDGQACTEDVCEGGACKHAPLQGCCAGNADCDDGDACTEDTCDPTTRACGHRRLPGCCTADAQCDDDDPCTRDACIGLQCGHEPVAGCCAGNADCGDGDPCTTDACDTTRHECSHTAVTGCCHNAGECNDGNPCTTDTCSSTTHQCGHAPVAGCCNASSGCDDGNACTTDVCTVNHTCVHSPVPGCCNSAAECNDGNSCTNDGCDTATHLCTHTGVSGCCTGNAQCDDGNVCNGAETCDGTNTCQPGTALNCNDGDACTVDTCNPQSGCQHATLDCNDGNACTTDGCDSGTGCTHTTVDCDDADVCTVDGCDFTSGCTHTPIPNCAPRVNDLCANAIDVSGMTTVQGSTLGAHHESDPPSACVNGSTSALGSPDVYYRLTITEREWVAIDLFGSAFDTVAYVLDGCGGNVVLGGAACNDDSGCAAPDWTRSAGALLLDPGSYIIVVDGYGPAAAGEFTLHLGRSGGACASAQAIASGTQVTATTVGGTTLLNPDQCASGSLSGPERIYFFFLCPVAGTFQVDAATCSSGTLDSVIYLRHGTCTSGNFGCDDDGCGTIAGPSSMSAPNLATGAGMYFVVVDTYGMATPGDFTLTVTY
jgi:hypothetical protein